MAKKFSKSIFVSIFKLFLLSSIVFLLFLLYWSYNLLEENVRSLRGEIKQIRQEVQSKSFKANEVPQPKGKSARPHIDQSLPNLLQEDPFMAKTLPELLPAGFQPSGILFSSTVGRSENLHPFSNWSEVSGWISLCSSSLARNKFGIWETFSPDMAIKIEERILPDGGKEFWIHLRENLVWQPLKQEWFTETLAPWFLEKHPVTAEDFLFGYDAVMNPHVQQAGVVASRTYLDEVEEVRVVDPLTLVVRWKVHDIDGQKKTKYVAKQITGGFSPLASFLYKYFPDGSKIVQDDTDPSTYRTNSVWAQNFSEHWARHIIASSGPYMFDGMSDEKIQFARNPDHYFPLDALILRLETSFKNSTDGIWQDFKAGNLSTYTLQPDQLLELQDFLKSHLYLEQQKQNQAINKLEFLSNAYFYIGWNSKNPLFSSKSARQAMTMAIDRRRIIEKNLNGLGVELTGPFLINSPSYDSAIQAWPFDPMRAKSLLAKEGWQDSNGDGILDKMIDGVLVSFRFHLTYFVKNPTMKAIAEYIQVAMKEIGVDCQLKGVDMADLSASFEDKSFDAIGLGWGTGSPPEDVKQLWSSSGAKEKGSSNAVGFSNEEADRIIQKLQFEDDRSKRIALYHRFHNIIHEEQPYTFLYIPKVIFLYREKVQNVFLPIDRQDLIPGANVSQPSSRIFWLK